MEALIKPLDETGASDDGGVASLGNVELSRQQGGLAQLIAWKICH
jgi:hypothetical protein